MIFSKLFFVSHFLSYIMINSRSNNMRQPSWVTSYTRIWHSSSKHQSYVKHSEENQLLDDDIVFNHMVYLDKITAEKAIIYAV